MLTTITNPNKVLINCVRNERKQHKIPKEKKS